MCGVQKIDRNFTNYNLLMQEVAKIADWKDEQICYVKKKLTEEGKQEDLSKGKELAQVFSLLLSRYKILSSMIQL